MSYLQFSERLILSFHEKKTDRVEILVCYWNLSEICSSIFVKIG